MDLFELVRGLLGKIDPVALAIIFGLIVALIYQTKRVAASEEARSLDRETMQRDILILTQTIERLTTLERLTNRRSGEGSGDER